MTKNSSRLLKKPHMLRCAQSPRSNVLLKYAFARRFFARLASETFLSSLQSEFFSTLLGLDDLDLEYADAFNFTFDFVAGLQVYGRHASETNPGRSSGANNVAGLQCQSAG